MTTATTPRCTSGEPRRSSRLSTSGVRKVRQPNWSYRHRQTCPSTNAASARYGSTDQSSVAMTHLPHIRTEAPGRSAARPTALARSAAGYRAGIATRYPDGSRSVSGQRSAAEDAGVVHHLDGPGERDPADQDREQDVRGRRFGQQHGEHTDARGEHREDDLEDADPAAGREASGAQERGHPEDERGRRHAPRVLDERHLTVDQEPDVRYADRRDKQRGDEVANGESHGCHLPSPPTVRPAGTAAHGRMSRPRGTYARVRSGPPRWMGHRVSPVDGAGV